MMALSLVNEPKHARLLMPIHVACEERGEQGAAALWAGSEVPTALICAHSCFNQALFMRIHASSVPIHAHPYLMCATSVFIRTSSMPHSCLIHAKSVPIHATFVPNSCHICAHSCHISAHPCPSMPNPCAHVPIHALSRPHQCSSVPH